MEELSAIIDRKMRERLIRELLSMDESEFARWMEHLLERMNFSVMERPEDAGDISVIGTYKGKTYFAVISRKGAGEFVTPEELQPIVGKEYDGELASPLYISTSDYTDEAKTYAEMVGISLVDGEKLAQLFDATGLMEELMQEKDREVIEQEGERWLPSAGELMAYMEEGQDLFARRKYKEAMEMFQKAAELKPSYDAAWRMVGACYHQLGDYHSAMDFYKMALSHDETDETYYLMGVTMYELGRYEDEIAYYKKALDINPKNVKALNNMGTTLYTLHRYEDALSCYQRIIEIDPGDEKVWNNLGVTLKKLGRIGEAADSFDRAIELNPAYADAWINKAALHHELGQFREAAESWHMVTSWIKDNPVIWYRKAEALFNIKQYSLTVDACDEALRLQSDFREAAQLRERALEMKEKEGDSELSPPFGTLYSREEPEPAEVRPLARGELGPSEAGEDDSEGVEPELPEESAAEVIEAEDSGMEDEEVSEPLPEQDEPEDESAEEEAEPEETEEVESDVEPEAVEMPEERTLPQPEAAAPVPSADAGEFMTRHTLEERAVVLASLGMTDSALEVMKKLAEVEDLPEYRNRLAILLFEAGDLESAVSHLRHALELDPGYYPAVYNLAYLHGINGDYEEEIDLLSSIPERGFRLDLRLSLALIKSGRPSEGAAIMEDIAERLDSEYLWNRIGVALMDADAERAGEAFAKALVINPRFYQAWNNRAVLFFKEGDVKSALKYTNQCLKLRPDYGPAWITRGLILQCDSRVDEALESFREAHLLLDNRYSAGNLAFAQLSAGDAKAALKTCLTAIEADVDGADAGLWNLLGLILMNLGHLDSAEACFRRAVELSPEFEEPLKNIGNLSMLEDVKKQRLGRNSSRVKALIEVISKGPSDAEEAEPESSTDAVAEGEESEGVEPEAEAGEDAHIPESPDGGEVTEAEAPTEPVGAVDATPEDDGSFADDIADEEGIADIEDDEFELSDDYAPLSEEEAAPPEEDSMELPEELSAAEESSACPRCGAVGSLVDGVCVLCGYVEEEGPSEAEVREEVAEDLRELEEVEDLSSDLEDLVEYAKSLEEEMVREIEGPDSGESAEEGEDDSEARDNHIDEDILKARRKEVEKQLSSLHKSELITMCKKRKIPVAGTKKDLVLRLSSAIVEEWKRMMEFLTAIPGVSSKKAQNIIDVGFSDPEFIKKASVEELSAVKGIGPATAKKIKEAAERL